MTELVAIFGCMGLSMLVGSRRKSLAPVALPWHLDQKEGVVTLAMWDRSSRAVHADGVILPGARMLTPRERIAILVAVDAWNARLHEAGVPLRVETVMAPSADILVFGADTLADARGRPLDGQTIHRVRAADSSLARIERASVVVTTPRACMSELGRALGLTLPASRRAGLPTLEDARMLLAAYGAN